MAVSDGVGERAGTLWQHSNRADPRANRVAKRHYSCQHPESAQFVPPGRCLVLVTADYSALWVTSWPFAEFTRHAWAGAWVNSLFRREPECPALASDLIRQAVAATRWYWPDVPALGMVTFVDASKVRHKREPGCCYKRSGFRHAGYTAGGLWVWQLVPAEMPAPEPPVGVTLRMGVGAA